MAGWLLARGLLQTEAGAEAAARSVHGARAPEEEQPAAASLVDGDGAPLAAADTGPLAGAGQGKGEL